MMTLLVGQHFSPPAKLLLQCVRGGASITIHPEPDNPYDPNALKVFIATSEIDYEALRDKEEELAGMGLGLEDITNQAEWPLGHIAAGEGKPLAKVKSKLGLDLVGTLELIQIGQWPLKGALVFDGTGEVLIELG